MKILEIIKRFLRMFKVKDCTHICLFCEYYDQCKDEEEMKISSEWIDVSKARSKEERKETAPPEDTA